MGFSCLICQGPFDQSGQMPANGSGDCNSGNGHRSVSVISKCGHIFHTECLRKSVDPPSQSKAGKAWVSMVCPICKIGITVLDICAVTACPNDNRPDQRRREEEMIDLHRALERRYEVSMKEAEVYKAKGMQLAGLNNQLRQRNQELGQSVENWKAEATTLQNENDYLRKIIVKLTGQLTANDCALTDIRTSPSGGNGNGMRPNPVRLEYSEELQRLAVRDAQPMMPQVVLSAPNMQVKPSNSHPPGFQFPMARTSDANENECQSLLQRVARVAETSQLMNAEKMANGPSGLHSNGFQKTFSVAPGSKLGPPIPLVGYTPEIKVDHDANNNRSNVSPVCTYSQKALGMYRTAAASAGNTLTTKAPASPAQIGERQLPGDQSAVSPITAEDSDNFADLQDSDKWFEKKGRRRGAGTSGKTGRGSSRDRGNGNGESERKLYGFFECPGCDAHWGSSQSFLNTPQTCRVCKTQVFPNKQGPILPRKQLEMEAQNNGASEAQKK